jgi:predicted transcriptional regulator
VNRAELGALRDAIDTILNWPDSVRDQIAQWLQTDASEPSGADPDRPSRSRSNRRGYKPGVEESAARERALLEAMRDDPQAGVVQWAKTTRCDKSAVSMRLGRLAKRGVVERDGNGRWRLAGANPTMPPSL